MKRKFKSLLVKLSYNKNLIAAAKKILKNFPALKTKLIYIRDGMYITNHSNSHYIYKSDFLESIKKEVELRKEHMKDSK